MLLTRFACWVFILFFFTSSTQAVLLSRDWQNPNDNLLTLDTDSGLEWLDWAYTVDRSYDDIASRFGMGGEFEGFRHATLDELSALYTNTGFNFPTNSDASNIPLAVNFVDLFGQTFSTTNGLGTEAIYNNPGAATDTFWVTAVNQLNGQVLPELFEFPSRSSAEFVGNAIVRTSVIPIPAAIWLFGSAALGLIIYSRKKTSA